MDALSSDTAWLFLPRAGSSRREWDIATSDARRDRAAPVFTLWEGVTMYLPEAAIAASPRAIRAWSYARSRHAISSRVRCLSTIISSR